MIFQLAKTAKEIISLPINPYITKVEQEFIVEELKKVYKRFALIGASGQAPRHVQAIKATENHLVAATDPHDNVGFLDAYYLTQPFYRIRTI